MLQVDEIGFFFSSRRRHTRWPRDWSSDVCSSDLVYPLAEGHAQGWPPYLFAMLAASVPVLAGFGWYQLRRQRTGAAPLVDPAIFRRRSYTSGVLFAVVFTASLGGIVLIFNVFLQ